MFRRTVSGILLTLLLASMLTLAFNIKPAKAIGFIYIRADGSVDPPSAPISNAGNYYYTFTANIYDSIVLERNNIVIDGAAHTLEGAGTGYGIVVNGTLSGVTIKSITIQKFEYGMMLEALRDSTISANTIKNNTFGIWLAYSSDSNIISANTISSNTWDGIHLSLSSGNSISGNTITNNYNGINLGNSSDSNSICANTISSNSWHGIYLSDSPNNSIERNRITNSGYCGVTVSYSSNNIINENIVTNNHGGIVLEYSSNNIVSENNITNNGSWGADVYASTGNLLCHNNFVGNTPQTYTTFGYLNFWDDGYPSGGNYWSDYSGVDVKSGPNQDQPGSDGIGDTMYYMDFTDADHYPLIAAWGSTLPIHVPEDYTSIQEAIDAATPWTTILIGPGTYSESVVVNKPLTIIGRLGSEPVFKGGGSGVAITLLAGASGSTVTGIVITSWDQGILVNDATDCKIYGNIMSLMNANGIIVQGAAAVNNQVYNNIFRQDLVAVNIASSSQNNNISRNIICLNNIALKMESSQNTACENTILNNQVGLNIVDSNNDVFYHNNFVNNTVQLSVTASTGNAWDNGYPSGGNYWSDFVGLDVKSGPNQDQTGSDGIVDTPYTVAIGSVDNYPLVRPFNAHGVGIMDYAVSKTVVGKGYSLSLEVKILNCGVYDENFLLAAYANASTVAAQELTLAKSNLIIVALTWNTSSFGYGNYTLNVRAEPVPNETNVADNILYCGTVYVGIPGDVNGDEAVDIYDAIVVANSFMSTSGSRKWNANANINNDNMVDIYDAIILAGNYGKTA